MTPGDKVILDGVPETLVYGLPWEDQEAICAAIGTEVEFVGMRTATNEAEVEFRAKDGTLHTIWIDLGWLRESHGGERE